VYLTTLLGVTALEYRQDPWLQKTRALRYRAVLLLRYDIFSHFKQKTLAKSKKTNEKRRKRFTSLWPGLC